MGAEQQQEAPTPQEHKDFFISYTSKDRAWAEWIAWQLEAEGYHVLLQAWDFRPGENFMGKMDQAIKTTKRTIAVLSPDYLDPKASYSYQELMATLVQDPTGQASKLVPVRVRECTLQGLLKAVIYVDLVDMDMEAARNTLLAGVRQTRALPQLEPLYPGKRSTPSIPAPRFPNAFPPIWNVPYPRNMLFTGREELLTQLAASLHAGQPTAISQPPRTRDTQLQAISGLGGIGKTQLALEYTYRSRGKYQAVLWAQADTKDTLTSSYLELATLLDLPEKNAQESAQVIVAMKRWLQRSTGYLLILDNADDLALAREFLPPSISGQVLLTTRAQATGRFAHRVEVDILPIEQGTEFLLRRAEVLADETAFEQARPEDRNTATSIYEELGGLPLALDQAGAYIKETQSSLQEYLLLYQAKRLSLFKEQGEGSYDHPKGVVTTWALSFQRVQESNPAAADLLRLCAFLAPDAIPETIITQGGKQLGPLLKELSEDTLTLKKAVGALGAYSLVKRDATNETLSIHRLVQAVLKDQMKEEEQREWAKRAVYALSGSICN